MGIPLHQNVNAINNVNMSNAATRRRAATLDRIAEEALALVAESGIDGLTMSALAKRVDYTAPALYRYVPSKGALIAELNRRILAEHRARLATAWADGPTPTVALERAAVELIRHAAEQPQAFGVVAITLGDPRRLVEDDAPAHMLELVGLIGDIARQLSAATEAGELTAGEPRERAVRWLFALFGTLPLAKLSRFDPRLAPERVTLALAHDLLAAWSTGGSR